MDRFDRNIGLFGQEGQARLRSHHVVFVGCGGLGEHCIQQAAFLGVGEITLIDDEQLSRSNLNRYVLARHDDPIPGTHKVDIAARAIAAIDPAIKVNKVYASLRSTEAFQGLHRADTIIGCLDNEGARLVLTEFALAYEKPYFDLATDIANSSEGVLRYGGRVVFTSSGSGCPVCLDVIDVSEARVDLEDEAARRDRENIYGVPRSALDEGGPSVVTVNGVIASLAMTEFMVYAVGLRDPQRHIVYRGHQGVVSINKDAPLPSCYFCETVRGAGEQANVERYILPPSSLQMGKANVPSRLEALLKLDRVDLKWMFDHFRNYGIAGALLYAALHVGMSKSVSPLPYFGVAAGIAFLFISIFLFTLNFIQGIKAYELFKGKRPGMWAYIVGYTLWFLLMQELLGIRLTPV